ncbi:putative head morphogenesis protein [Klebsiella phage vB_KaeD_HazelMika]|nr:putative head morphogenesis protein [Klebsiella phage vB_KaeD_HazelMika]
MKVKRIVKAWRYPEASERQLGRSLSEFASDLVVFARDKLDGMRFDASDAEINNAEKELEDYAAELLASLAMALPALALQIYKFNSKQWYLVAVSAGGAKNEAVALLDLLGASANETWYQEKQQQWLSLTEASYRKLANDIIADWSHNVRRANIQAKGRDYVDEVIEQRYKVYTGWSYNRSRGIVATWNSILMRQRLDDAGVTHYLWRGKLDERERLKHLRWEGKRIGVDSDHIFPGEEYGCRCWAEPDFTT